MSDVVLYWLLSGFLLLPSSCIVPALGAGALGLVAVGVVLGRWL